MSQAESASHMSWRKSSRCEAQACVEVARMDAHTAVRNSTAPHSAITFTNAAWRVFVDGVKAGELHR
jgi:hypothetical protein